MRGLSTALIVAFALGSITVSAGAQAPGSDPKARAMKNPVPATAASITAGQRAYGRNCRHCHGLRGRGDGALAPTNPRPPDLTDDKWNHGSSDGEIFAIISNGAPAENSEMKPMKDVLAATDIWSIVRYIRSLGPKPGAR